MISPQMQHLCNKVIAAIGNAENIRNTLASDVKSMVPMVARPLAADYSTNYYNVS